MQKYRNKFAGLNVVEDEVSLRARISNAVDTFLEESPVKYLGDAWMLATALMERSADYACVSSRSV